MLTSIEHWQNRFEEYLKDHPLDDGSHDITHFRRVWKLAEKFADDRTKGAKSPNTHGETDRLVLLAACYFHDLVSYPKNHPKRARSSTEAATKAGEILQTMGFPENKLAAVQHCIEAHSFSAGIPTQTLEAEIVQDADRIESLGAIGLARVFYVAGRMGSQLFCGEDPFAENRDLDDQRYAVDHFKTKLFRLPETMKTKEGRLEAQKRKEVLENFLSDLALEL